MNPTPQKQPTMAQLVWDNKAITFTLCAHASGHCPAHIHALLVLHGYTRLQLYTVEQCLRAHGREIDHVNPNYRPPYKQHGAAAIVHGDGIAWNDLADRFSISAHRVGFSVIEIWYQMRQRGYAVSAAEVAASLTAQGVSNVRVADYLQ